MDYMHEPDLRIIFNPLWHTDAYTRISEPLLLEKGRNKLMVNFAKRTHHAFYFFNVIYQTFIGLTC